MSVDSSIREEESTTECVFRVSTRSNHGFVYRKIKYHLESTI